MLHLKKNNNNKEKNTCRYHYENLDTIYSSWDIAQHILKLVILGRFLPFYLPKNPINQNFQKWKNLLEISSFYTCVPKITIKFWKKKWKKCLDILSFYTYMCIINEDHMIYGSWNIRCDRQKFLSFWAIFCPFSPLTTWKIKILTLKKTPGDIIILQTWMTVIWCMVPQIWSATDIIFCHFGLILPFYPLATWKIKILKKWKNCL